MKLSESNKHSRYVNKPIITALKGSAGHALKGSLLTIELDTTLNAVPKTLPFYQICDLDGSEKHTSFLHHLLILNSKNFVVL